ncbi:putative cytochrome P450 [Astrocystis sublimbata]|nr:putative cytochrome P450 [Astrocystis sublimbata]
MEIPDTQILRAPAHTTLIVATVLGLYIIASLLTWVYNVYFHPLAGFPGPKIAAASGLYEFYYDVVKGGQYLYKIEEMHRKYGPIIRINPSEIVVNDPSFYDEVYVTASTRRTNIWPRYRTGYGVSMVCSAMMTEDHDLHRRRRKPLEPFFSQMSDRLEQLRGTKSVVCLDYVFVAFAGDMIGKICCDNPPTMMAKEEFGKEWHALMERVVASTLIFAHLPQLVYLARLIPTRLLCRIDPGVSSLNEFREDSAVDEKPNLFRYIATSDMPRSEQSVERLGSESMILFGAATNTTSATLILIAYYILSNPQMEERLRNDLAPLMLDYPNNLARLADLERHLYLQAVIKEGLRLSFGLMPLQYKQWTIPKGTPVGMGAYSLHTNFRIYPEPFKFSPERWLGDYNPKMDECLVPFTRGSRKCLGYNLALAELNWVLAVLFRPNGPKLSLYETEASDVTPARDFLSPLPRAGSRGCRVIVE